MTEEELSEVALSHCTKDRGSVLITRLAELQVARDAQFLFLARVYALGFHTLNPTLCDNLVERRVKYTI